MSIDYDNLTHDDLLNMSEEDFAKLDPSKLVDKPIEAEQPQDQGEAQPQTEQPEPTTEVEQEPEPEGEVETEPDSNETASEAEQSQAESEAKANTEPLPTVEDKPTVTTEVEVTPEKAFFDKVTAEFKANGKAFKVDSAEDVISLMQKGLNYNQRMADMKPAVKVLKALQEQGINSVEELGYLFDLKNRNPEAIAKLIQESGLDTYELNEEKAKAYQPSVPHVDDATINFEMTAKALEGNPHFGTLVTHLPNFDEQTKQHIFANPGLMNILTDHIASGQFDAITARLDHERAVGRLLDVPFLTAYDNIGKMLFSAPQQQQPAPVPAVQPTQVATPVAQKVNTSNNAARKAAASAPSTATQSQKVTLTPDDIWNMSEEDFAKIDPKFLV